MITEYLLPQQRQRQENEVENRNDAPSFLQHHENEGHHHSHSGHRDHDERKVEVEYNVNPTRLFSLLDNFQFRSAVTLLSADPGEAQIWILNQVKGEMNWKYLPLHLVCLQPTAPYKTWYELIMALVNSYPDGVKKKDHTGNLPLHLVCRESSSFNGHISIVSVFKREVERVIDLLLRVYPESLNEQDEHGHTAMQIIENQTQKHGITEVSGGIIRIIQRHISKAEKSALYRTGSMPQQDRHALNSSHRFNTQEEYRNIDHTHQHSQQKMDKQMHRNEVNLLSHNDDSRTQDEKSRHSGGNTSVNKVLSLTIRNLESQLAEFEQKKDKIAGEMNSAMKTMEKEHSKEIKEKQDTISTLTAEVRTMSLENASLSKNTSNLTKTCQLYQNKIKELARKNQKMKAQRHNIDDNIKKISEKAKEKEKVLIGSVDELKTQNKMLKEEMSNVKQNEEANNARIQTLVSKQKLKNEDISRLLHDMASLRKKTMKDRSAANEYKRQFEDISEKKTELTNANEHLKNLVKSNKTKYHNKLQEMSEVLEKLRDDNVFLRGKLHKFSTHTSHGNAREIQTVTEADRIHSDGSERFEQLTDMFNAEKKRSAALRDMADETNTKYERKAMELAAAQKVLKRENEALNEKVQYMQQRKKTDYDVDHVGVSMM